MFLKRIYIQKQNPATFRLLCKTISQKTIRKCYWILKGKDCDHSNMEVILRYAKSPKYSICVLLLKKEKEIT